MCCVILLKGMLPSEHDRNALIWLTFTDYDHEWKLLNLASVSHFGGNIYVKNWLSVFIFSLSLKYWNNGLLSQWAAEFTGKVKYMCLPEKVTFSWKKKEWEKFKGSRGFFPFPWSLSLKSDIPKAFIIDFCLVCFQNPRLHYLLPEQSHVLVCVYIYYKKNFALCLPWSLMQFKFTISYPVSTACRK